MTPSLNNPVPAIESTYRLQFHKEFTLQDGIKVIPYLNALGITTCYSSPLLKAGKGSTHGYDVVDPTRLNPEIGSEADFAEFVTVLKKHNMSLLLDIVPNHMGVGTNESPWWNDILKYGRQAEHAEFFDIDWNKSDDPSLRNKVLLPVLGKSAEQAIEAGELYLTHALGSYHLHYGDREFPISPESVSLAQAVARTETLEDKVASLKKLHSQQHYHLAFWRRAACELNYRRFFDINSLAALKMERQEVFSAAHEWVLNRLRAGEIAGLRIDHPDGLYDPLQYFQRLRNEAGQQAYLVVEKILALNEPLPTTWPVNGTTGYDFLAVVNALFVDPDNVHTFTRLYNEWISDSTDFAVLARASKNLVLGGSFSGELSSLAKRIFGLSRNEPVYKHLSVDVLQEALRAVIACFPIYRTYITSRGASEADQKCIRIAFEAAIRQTPSVDQQALEFIVKTLLLNQPAAAAVQQQAEFAARFQQLTSPVTAKGIEDTLFYNYNRLISLNEVGGDPNRFGLSDQALHAYFADRQQHWPCALSSGSTHDTKRSEDVRARINVLSEIPDDWRAKLYEWGSLNAIHRTTVGERIVPTRNEELLIYQTLLGAWPRETMTSVERQSFLERIKAYMTKAMREAKVNTTWTEPNVEHESSVHRFIEALIAPATNSTFLKSFTTFQATIHYFGMLNSLSQTVLRLTAPGVPDTYQGMELWDLSLVDPDNRRPVDFSKRVAMLATALPHGRDDSNHYKQIEMLESGLLKMLTIQRILRLRRSQPGFLSEGSYTPLQAYGTRSRHVFAFLRQAKGFAAIVVVPRFMCNLYRGRFEWPLDPAKWGDTYVACDQITVGRRFKHVISGTEIAAPSTGQLLISKLLADVPYGVFISDESSDG